MLFSLTCISCKPHINIIISTVISHKIAPFSHYKFLYI
nr:MAG TPA: hypothetical protein [Caudoviricetes sp.]